jgi:uncharacterized protein (TIGR02246 family)
MTNRIEHTDTEARESDDLAIKTVIAKFVNAFCRGDVDAIEPLFTPDAVVYPSNDRDRVGWSDIADYWAKPFESLAIRLRVDIQNLTIRDDLAVAEMMTFADVAPKCGGETTSKQYRDMVVLRKLNGSWRIHRNLSQSYPMSTDG